MKTRAAKGGEVGANGEEYKGGQFINTIAENPKKEGSTPRRRVNMPPMFGYLLVGLLIGPHALSLLNAKQVPRFLQATFVG